jgi:hypothetical protein
MVSWSGSGGDVLIWAITLAAARRNATAQPDDVRPATFPRRSRKAFYVGATQLYPMNRIVFVLFALLFAGCGRPTISGLYQSVGSEDKFRMSLEVVNGGTAKFTTRANLGNAELDRALESTMSIRDGRWTKDGVTLLVAGTQGDGKTATYRFVIQENGDLIWDKNGARLVKTR